MKLSDFTYPVPQELIAQYPLIKRDRSRLMVVNRARQSIQHAHFSDLNQFLPPRSHLVLNNSKVLPVRLLGKREKGTAEVEIFLLRKLSGNNQYEALLRPLKRLKEGEKIFFPAADLVATVIDKEKRIVSFNKKNLKSVLERIGHMPLPPYIARSDEKKDRISYQTVFAKHPGSVAAPTAGLHFTKSLLQSLNRAGHKIDFVTLHVGYGTFQPVECEDITEHEMHTESYSVTQRAYHQIQESKKKGTPLVAVGTTACRTLETLALTQKQEGETNLFIYPGFSFRMVDHLLTNFHLPKSTLLMLVCAFGGMDLIKKAYKEAIDKKYRFYSYGDAMLIL